MSFALSQPIRTVLRWQLLATALAILVLVGLPAHTAQSLRIGRRNQYYSGLAAAWYALRKPAGDAATAVTSALIAEGLRFL